MIFCSVFAGGDAGAPSKGGRRGRKTPRPHKGGIKEINRPLHLILGQSRPTFHSGRLLLGLGLGKYYEPFTAPSMRVTLVAATRVLPSDPRLQFWYVAKTCMPTPTSPNQEPVRFPEMALLAAIVESSDDAIISKDLSGIIQSWNSAAERIFGYTKAEAVGRSITMLIPKDRLPEETLILEKVRRGERVDHFETVRMHKDGSRVLVSLTDRKSVV